MPFSSSATRSALKVLSSSRTAGRSVQPPLRLSLPSASSLSLSCRSIASSASLSFNANDDMFPKTLPADPTTSTPSSKLDDFKASFPPNFFTPLSSTSALQEALEAAEEFPLSFLPPAEQANHRLLIRHLQQGIAQPTLQARIAFFTALDANYAPRSDIDRRQREKARRQIEAEMWKEDELMTTEEWDARSGKIIEEKLVAWEAKLEGDEEGEALSEEEREDWKEKKRVVIKRKIVKAQAVYRRERLLRMEVRREMELEKEKEEK